MSNVAVGHKSTKFVKAETCLECRTLTLTWRDGVPKMWQIKLMLSVKVLSDITEIVNIIGLIRLNIRACHMNFAITSKIVMCTG